MTRLQTIVFLIFGFLSTILFEIFFNYLIQSSSPKITLLEHIQSSLKLTTLINVIILGSIFLILLMGLLILVHHHGIIIIYITLLKFFELIPPLIDLINLLFIYRYKTSNRLNLSLFFALIRLIISLNVVRRKCDCRWKRQMIVIVDLLLFILVNISLLRYLNKNLIRIGRKIILGLLIFQLNDLFYNETFWISLTTRNDYIRQLNSRVSKNNSFNNFYSMDYIISHYLFIYILHISISNYRWLYSFYCY